jgi:nucleoside-diphosphate-sugar epimerase
MKFTILGSLGFVGSHLLKALKYQAIEVFAPPRDYIFTKGENLGHVIYCIGLTSDFRQRPIETVEAHVCKLMKVLENSEFESFLYLSSTRVYGGNDTGMETDNVQVSSSDFSDLYNISKLMGESICLSNTNKRIRVVRLSNVIGDDFESDNYLFSLIKEAVDTKMIHLNLHLEAGKDYISINDVVKIVILIAKGGKHRIYNIGSGFQITNDDIVKKIKEYNDCEILVSAKEGITFPQISIERIVSEFDFAPTNILNEINQLIEHYKQKKHDTN